MPASICVLGSAFRELVAYRLAADLANDLYDVVSVAANIAEADGRFSSADRRRFLLIARGSLYETEHWMVQAEKRGLLPEGSSERVEEIAKTLNGLVKRPAPS